MPEAQRHGSGIVYIATGEAYARAAVDAATSARAHNPDLPIILFTDQNVHGGPFTRIEPIEHPLMRSKVDYLGRTPFERTLYLDSDTRVAGDLTGMFALLDRFDLAVAHVGKRHAEKHLVPWRGGVPRSFPQHNCGVLLYRSTLSMLEFLNSWQVAYREAGVRQDQVTFRELLWRSDLRYYVLPPEWNTRRRSLCQKWSRHEPPVMIWHLEGLKPHRKTRWQRIRRRLERRFGPLARSRATSS